MGRQNVCSVLETRFAVGDRVKLIDSGELATILALPGGGRIEVGMLSTGQIATWSRCHLYYSPPEWKIRERATRIKNKNLAILRAVS